MPGGECPPKVPHSALTAWATLLPCSAASSALRAAAITTNIVPSSTLTAVPGRVATSPSATACSAGAAMERAGAETETTGVVFPGENRGECLCLFAPVCTKRGSHLFTLRGGAVCAQTPQELLHQLQVIVLTGDKIKCAVNRRWEGDKQALLDAAPPLPSSLPWRPPTCRTRTSKGQETSPARKGLGSPVARNPQRLESVQEFSKSSLLSSSGAAKASPCPHTLPWPHLFGHGKVPHRRRAPEDPRACLQQQRQQVTPGIDDLLLLPRRRRRDGLFLLAPAVPGAGLRPEHGSHHAARGVQLRGELQRLGGTIRGIPDVGPPRRSQKTRCMDFVTW